MWSWSREDVWCLHALLAAFQSISKDIGEGGWDVSERSSTYVRESCCPSRPKRCQIQETPVVFGGVASFDDVAWFALLNRAFFGKSQREGLQQPDGNIDTLGPTPPPRVTVLIRTVLPSFQLHSCRFMLAGYKTTLLKASGQVQPGENTLMSVSPCPYGLLHITYKDRERVLVGWGDADSVKRILNSCTMTDDLGSGRDVTHSGQVWHVMGGGLLAACFLWQSFFTKQ